MADTINIVYVGFSEVALKNILELRCFNVVAVICPEDRISDQVVSLCNNSIKLYKISKKEELFEIFNLIKAEIYLIYKFPIIVPKELCQKYSIFNIHPGDLRLNRGAHPVVWTILQGHTESKMTLYKLGEEIDLGEVISECKVIVAKEDDTVSLEKKLESKIPCLIQDLCKYATDVNSVETEIISSGIYLRKINEIDFTINLESDGLDVISRKIRSQKKFKGAVLNIYNSKYYIIDVQYMQESRSLNFVTLDNNQIQVKYNVPDHT